MSYINFESSIVKENERKERKQARDNILAKAEAKYNSRKATKEKEKWMLQSVEERIEAESRKEKKYKKKQKAKRKSSSDSSDDSEDKDEWVEKVDKESDDNIKKADNKQVKREESSVTERDEWMTLTGLFPCVTHEKSKRISKAEAEKQKDKYMLDRLGQTDRELNPYWKDGGTGLPQERDGGKHSKEPTLSQKAVGDHGVDWLRRALKHAKEQAAEEGRTLEEVAAERWGSLKNLETMLADAEKKNRLESDYRRHESSGRQEWVRRNEKEERNYDRYSDKDQDRYNRIENRGRDGKNKSYSSRYEKPDSREKSKNYSSSYSGRFFQKPKDEIDVPRVFRKPADSELDVNSYRTTSGSGNWRKKSSNEAQQTTRKIQETPRKTSSSSSDSEVEEIKPKEQTSSSSSILSDKEMNDLGAKLVKAEILGNEQLAKQLRSKLEAARVARTLKHTSAVVEETVVLTRRDSRGFVHPLQQSDTSGGPRKKQKVETHKDGSRIRYFADDDKHSLQDLFEREKLSTVEDQNEMFIKLAGKVGQNDMDDIFEEQARVKESSSKIQAREKNRAIREHKMVDRVLENCHWCFDSKEMLKHLIVAIGTKVYLCLPPHQSLTEGHCFIVPMFHTPCATQLDEDVWNEMQTFKKTLVKLFKDKDDDVVFFETAIYLKKFPHMLIECVPMAKEIGDMAPIYFKKAILECETEWAINKKLVDLKGKDVRRAVPKGLPYFTVDFGVDPGFAHVVEDEKNFPKNFAQEIIGGMLDLDHSIWRKQRKDNFDTQRKKVMQFAEWWKPYDFTVKNSSDSE